MPWRPSFDDADPDPRLDPYRGRVGSLSLDGAPTGYVLVETDVAQLREGGRLWWTRWAPPTECAIVSILTDGDVLDGMTHVEDDLTERIGEWGRGAYHLVPGHQITWLDDAESDRLHHEVFGHDH